MTCGCISNEKKMMISAQTALIALIVFSPIAFQATGIRMIASAEGLPTTFGLILHAIVFGLVIYLLMKPKMPRRIEQSLPQA